MDVNTKRKMSSVGHAAQFQIKENKTPITKYIYKQTLMNILHNNIGTLILYYKTLNALMEKNYYSELFGVV